MYWEKYYVARSTAEAVGLLEKYGGSARLIAGGTDLMIQLKEKQVTTKTLVDIGGVEELRQIREENGRVIIGASVTHSNLAASPYLQKHFSILADAARSVGSPQIRNAGTIGGNVANAQPAADGVIALVALDARLHLLTPDGPIEKPVVDIFLSPGECTINCTQELITAVSFEAPTPQDRNAFARHSRRAALAMPIINMGLWFRLDDTESNISDARIAIGPMARVPFRARKTEEFMRGAPMNAATIDKASEIALEEVTPRDSFRGSAAYKKQMVKVFLKRAILAATGERSDNIQ